MSITPGSEEPLKCRVLVVDDDRDTVDSTALLFQLHGHDTRSAYDGCDALAQAIAFRPDIVLLDIAMPKMDGYEVARALRNIPAHKEPLLVAVTGLAERNDKLRSAESGFDVHLTKPVDFNLFEETILLWRQTDLTREATRELAFRHASAVKTFLSMKIEMTATLLDVAATTTNPAARLRCLQQARIAHDLMVKWLNKAGSDLVDVKAALAALKRRYDRIAGSAPQTS